jgi:iron complex outermembrane recepter protein
MSRNIYQKLAGLGAVSLLALATPALAQGVAPQAAADAPNEGLEDIVVTARKRSESLIEAPVAVTAIGATDLTRYNSSDLTKIGQMAPQLQIIRAPSGAGATFNIRGIGSSPLEPGLDQSVSVNLDGIQLGRGRFITLGMFDLQQVEVLKGPQALFFGKNSPAGVVSLTTAGGTDTFEAQLMGGYEFRADEKYVEGYVSGPIAEGLKGRIAFRYSDIKGWVRNLAQPLATDPLKPGLSIPGAATKRLPSGDNIAARGTLDYENGDGFTATLKVSYGRDRSDSLIGAQETICAPGVVPTQYGAPDPYTECGYNRAFANSAYNPGAAQNYKGANGGVPYSDTDIFLTSLNLNLDLGELSIASVTGYGVLDFKGFDSFSFSSFPEIVAYNSEKTKSFSQELRLTSDYDGPVNFMVGAYYEKVNRDDIARPMLFFVGADSRNGQQFSYQRDAFNRNDAISAFGQIRWEIVDDLELAAGTRYTRETKKLNIGNSFINNAYPPGLNPEGQVVRGKVTFTDWSPEATLSWHPTRNSTLYAAYKTGYKSGGFTNPLIFNTVAGPEDFTFTPESAKGGEIGYKAKLLDNRLRFEVDAYYYTFSGLQLSSFDAATLSYYVKNAGKARTKGIEASAEFKASSELLLRASGGYNRARYVSFPTAQCYQLQTPATGCIGGIRQDLAGRQLTRAPDFVGSAGFSYDRALAGDLMLGLDGDVRYSTSYAVDEALTPFIKQGSYALLNASIRLYPSSERWQLALVGRNLTDKNYHNFAQDQPAASPGSWAVQIERPREIALQAKMKF